MIPGFQNIFSFVCGKGRDEDPKGNDRLKVP